jgi:hypothetical protein
MERRDFLKSAGIGAVGASAAVTGIGALVSPAIANENEIPCPFLDGHEGRGATIGRALEALFEHIRDAHTSAIPEPYRTEVRGHMTACAHVVGEHLPV